MKAITVSATPTGVSISFLNGMWSMALSLNHAEELHEGLSTIIGNRRKDRLDADLREHTERVKTLLSGPLK